MAVFFYWASNSPSLLNAQREKMSDTAVDRWFIPLSTRVLYIQKGGFIHPKGSEISPDF